MDVGFFVRDFVVVLLAGTISGILCRHWLVSPIAGYLVMGAVIGGGGLQLVSQPGHELQLIAEAGALLLLFSVGIEFSIDELVRLRRFFFVGGIAQMACCAIPLILVGLLIGLSPPAAFLAGLAGSFSSTVLVFRALRDEGQADSLFGRQAISVLLFQDATLVPLLLLIPLMTGEGFAPAWTDYLKLSLIAASFLASVFVLHRLMAAFLAPRLAALRSVEIVVLVTITLLCGLSWVAHACGLPPAIGAFAAGLVLAGNRLSKQIDAIILPFRETFAAVFFVTLGMLLQPRTLVAEPLLLTLGVIAMLALKTGAAAFALRLVGSSWRSALGMGLGLSQLGEFSFMLVSQGVRSGLITSDDYNRMLFIAVATLIATPFLLSRGLAIASQGLEHDDLTSRESGGRTIRAAIIGIGPIGGQMASRLETEGVDTVLMDMSPLNLHAFVQAGFATVVGDARQRKSLLQARIPHCDLIVVSVHADKTAIEIVKAVRKVNKQCPIVVRCRFQSSFEKLNRAGASRIVSEEQEAAGPLFQRCAEFLRAIP